MQTATAAPTLSFARASVARPAARGVPALKARTQRAVVRRAAVQVVAADDAMVPKVPATPMGLKAPTREPQGLKPRFIGFYEATEVINGRAAMIGLFALCALEGITSTGLLELLGYEVGNGINIGF